jgi:hypothetical protein
VPIVASVFLFLCTSELSADDDEYSIQVQRILGKSIPGEKKQEELIALGNKAVPAILESIYTHRFVTLIEVLGELRDERATYPLMNLLEMALKDPQDFREDWIIDALRKISDPHAESLLERIVSDTNINISTRFIANTALIRLASEESKRLAIERINSDSGFFQEYLNGNPRNGDSDAIDVEICKAWVETATDDSVKKGGQCLLDSIYGAGQSSMIEILNDSSHPLANEALLRFAETANSDVYVGTRLDAAEKLVKHGFRSKHLLNSLSSMRDEILDRWQTEQPHLRTKVENLIAIVQENIHR